MRDHDETPTTRLLWVDTQTTGTELEPDAQILEIGAIVTEADLTPVAALHTLFSIDVDKLRMSERGWQVHTANGLLDEFREHDVSFSGSVIRTKEEVLGFGTLPGHFGGIYRIDRFDSYFAEFINTHARGAPLAGSRIGFHRRMMAQAGFTRSLSLLHYRNFDVSTFREAIRLWAPGRKLPPKSDRHRVFDDLAASIAIARMARDLLGRDDVESEISDDPDVMVNEWHDRSCGARTINDFMGWTTEEYGRWVEAEIVGQDPYSEFTSTPPSASGWYAVRFSDTDPDRFQAVYFELGSDQIAWRTGGETLYRPVTDVDSWGESLGSGLYEVGSAVTDMEREHDGIGVWAQLGPGETFTKLDEIEIEISTDPQVMFDEWHDSDAPCAAYDFMGWTERQYEYWANDPDAHPDADPGPGPAGPSPGPDGPSRAPPFNPAPGIPSWYAATYKLIRGWYTALFTETAPDRLEHVYFDPEDDHVVWRSGGETRRRPISHVVVWGDFIGPNWISDETGALLDEGNEVLHKRAVECFSKTVLNDPEYCTLRVRIGPHGHTVTLRPGWTEDAGNYFRTLSRGGFPIGAVLWDPDTKTWVAFTKLRHGLSRLAQGSDPESLMLTVEAAPGPNAISDETRALLDEGDDEITHGPGVDPEDTAVLDAPDETIGPAPTNPKPFDEDIPF